MEIKKQFIRFVVEEKGNGKIKVVNKIIKVFDEKDSFIEVEKPYAYATDNQINVDIPVEKGIQMSDFFPFSHFKHIAGKIAKRTDAEIQAIDEDYNQRKQIRLQEIEAKEQKIGNAKNIIVDKTKPIEERVNAMSDYIKSTG